MLHAKSSLKTPNTEIKSVLILLPRQLGDVLLGTPLLQVLRERFPNARLEWFAHPMAKKILDNHPYLDFVHYYPIPPKKTKGYQFWPQHILNTIAFWYASLAFALQFRKKSYDVIIDAMNNPRTALQTLLCKGKLKISFYTHPTRNWVYDVLLDRDLLTKGYLGHSRIHLLSPLGIDLEKLNFNKVYPTLPFGDAEIAKTKLWLATLSPGRPIILLSPTHRHAVRQWPKEKYAALGHLLIKNHNVQIVWLWGPEEEAFVAEAHLSLQKKLGELHALSQMAPLLSLRETAALASQSLGWVGNSNGLSHVVVAAKCKTLELHGPTYPQSWCHPDNTQHQWIQRQEGCIQCSKNECSLPIRECLELLNVEEVYQKFIKLLNL